MTVAAPSSVTQTPSPMTLGALRKYVANFMQMPNDDNALEIATGAINAAIDFSNTREWNWSVKYQDITLTAGTADYSLNSDWKKPRRLERLNSSSATDGALQYEIPHVFWSKYPSATSNGNPVAYTNISNVNYNTITLNVAPSSSFVTSYPTLRSWYYARLQRLVQIADTLVAPPEFWVFVGWYARWELATVYGNTAMADRAYGIWQAMWRQLIADDRDTETDF